MHGGVGVSIFSCIRPVAFVGSFDFDTLAEGLYLL